MFGKPKSLFLKSNQTTNELAIEIINQTLVNLVKLTDSIRSKESPLTVESFSKDVFQTALNHLNP